ncbi:MAG: hypothetical protein AAGC60_20470 [Acidobacteriota bacterium]
MNTTSRFPVVAATVFTLSGAIGALGFTAVDGAHRSSVPTEIHAAHAAWVSTAESVGEQVREADLVVRVQAIDRAAPRALWSPVPESARSQAPGAFLFTDTRVEVLEVYKGEAEIGDRLWVLQTGGDTTNLRGAPVRLALGEDPLYDLGSELVLFLIDISQDPVHAEGRDLFRTVNPAGRYDVDGGLVSRVALGSGQRVASDLGSLKAEIDAALRTPLE